MKKLQCLQIGCGAFANGQHLPNLKEREDAEIRICCDPVEAAAKGAAEKFGAPKWSLDWREAIKDPELDFIQIATPHDLHLPIIREAAARGLHVFCEKPMAMSEPEAWEIIRAVKHGNIKLCVDFNRRMSPAMHALKARVNAHQANPTHNPWRYIETERAPFPEEEKTNLFVRIQDESSSYRLIHMDPAHGGGQIIGETVHWLDLACWFFAPAIPVEVTGWGSARLTHGVNVVFSDGNQATITFDCCGTFDYFKEYYEVTSHAALFQSYMFVENRYWGVPGLTNEYFPLTQDGFPEVPGEGIAGLMAKGKAMRDATMGNNIKGTWGSLDVNKGHKNMLDGFLKAVKTGCATPCDEYCGLQATLLARIAIQSIRQKQTLPVPVDELRPAMA